MAPQAHGEARGSQLPSVQLEVPSKETLSRISTEEAIVAQLRGFVRGDAQLTERYLQRLRAIHSTLSACRPFSEHQFINSSLLFVHDVRARARASTATGRTAPLAPPPLPPPPLPPLAPSRLGPTLTTMLRRAQAARQRCGVWMIDFSKARPAKAPLTHIADRQLGNQEDGYLFGLTNMIRVWEGISVEGA